MFSRPCSLARWSELKFELTFVRLLLYHLTSWRERWRGRKTWNNYCFDTLCLLSSWVGVPYMRCTNIELAMLSCWDQFKKHTAWYGHVLQKSMKTTKANSSVFKFVVYYFRRQVEQFTTCGLRRRWKKIKYNVMSLRYYILSHSAIIAAL